jgi:hypothetical protein
MVGINDLFGATYAPKWALRHLKLQWRVLPKFDAKSSWVESLHAESVESNSQSADYCWANTAYLHAAS